MRDATRGHVLLAGVSTRALAVSAAAAGYQVTAADAFGDLDLRAVADLVPVARPLGHFHPGTAAKAAAPVPASMVAYTSSFENDPAAVARLSLGRALLGNPPAVLVRVRNPLDLMRRLRAHGFPVLATRASPPGRLLKGRAWLLKRRRSGGGHGIKQWRPGQPVSRGSYLQEYIAGTPGSVVFAADGRTAIPLGFSRQIIGETRLGGRGFRYCGSLLATAVAPFFADQEQLLERATLLAQTITREFGLVGLNGIDFIAKDGVPYPVEVNPRYCASMELVERAAGISLFDVHTRAGDGVLPTPVAPTDRVYGKAIVFARRDTRVGDTRGWLTQASLADVPRSGEKIRRGRPICTVFADAPDGNTCQLWLIQRAKQVYRLVESGKRRVA
jgi:predicted ATP-grasp superfamily ATP-dependent carboligase